jgi:hypothetical protein
MMIGFDTYYCDKKSDYLFVKYEEILENPVDFIKKVCDHYGLDFHKFPIDKIEILPVIGSSSISNQGQVTWQATEKPKTFNSTQHWLAWSAEEKQTFKEIAGQTLIDLNYEKHLDW